MVDKQFITLTSDDKIKINPLGNKGDLCNICENRGSTCMYCSAFDMFWFKDQETSEKLSMGDREIALEARSELIKCMRNI